MTLTAPTHKRACRSKDPEHCKVHGHPVTADDLYQAFMKDQHKKQVARKAATPKVQTPRSLVNRALKTSLGWQGAKPTWWEKYQGEVTGDKLIPSTAELIDVIDSPAGKLAVVWQEESQDDVDRSITLDSGIAVHAMYYKSFETGETLGYVKQQYMTEDTFKRSFGDDEFTPFRFTQRNGGHHFDLTDRDREDRGAAFTGLTGDALIQKRREVWAAVMKTRLGMPVYVDGQHISSYNVNASHAPEDAQVRKDLKKISRKIQSEIDETRQYFAVPFVDYSEVDYDHLQGKGFGAALYVYTARKLAERGQVLRGSGIQSDDAQGVWANFVKHLPEHVKDVELPLRGKVFKNPTLDFR